MKIIILTLLFGLLGYTICKPLDSNDDGTEALVEIERQRLIKFPEELEKPVMMEGQEQHDEAKRILQEIEKINQSLGYVKKQEQSRSPAILDSSQYLFPNTGYQPFHTQSSQVKGHNGETLLLPSIRSVKYNEASEYNVPPTRKWQKPQKTTRPQNPLYFKPQRVELAAPQTDAERQLLPTHFVIPVRLYKHNKQQYIEKHNPQEYKIKGYKIVGDIDHFYGKTKFNKTLGGSKSKTTPKYHLFFLPEQIVPKNSLTDIKAEDVSSNEPTREKQLNNRPANKVQSSSQVLASGNTLNATSSAQIVKKRVVPRPLRGGNNNVSVSSNTIIKVQPTVSNNGNGQQSLPNLQITQLVQPTEATPSYAASNNQPTKPNNNNKNQIIKSTLRPQQNQQSNNNNNNNNNNSNNNNAMKNRPLLDLQTNINNINNATTNAIKTAFQNIFRLPFRPQDPAKPSTATELTPMETIPLQVPQFQQQQPQQQFYYPVQAMYPQSIYSSDNFQNDHLDSDYKWDDENQGSDSSNSEDQDQYNGSAESPAPEEKNVFSGLLKQKQETQQEALKQGGIIIQKLKVRKGGIAIAGPGGVATAGSGGTAIVGPGGYALTHPRSLTIAGPGAKVIAIPSDVDLKDALERTDLKTKVFPREGRIVATGPTVYYAPPTGDYIDV